MAVQAGRRRTSVAVDCWFKASMTLVRQMCILPAHSCHAAQLTLPDCEVAARGSMIGAPPPAPLPGAPPPPARVAQLGLLDRTLLAAV